MAVGVGAVVVGAAVVGSVVVVGISQCFSRAGNVVKKCIVSLDLK